MIRRLGGELARLPVDQMLQLASRAFDHLKAPHMIVLRLSIVSESEEVLDHFEGRRTAEKGLLVHAEKPKSPSGAEQACRRRSSTPSEKMGIKDQAAIASPDSS
jgi:hypothetical protein